MTLSLPSLGSGNSWVKPVSFIIYLTLKGCFKKLYFKLKNFYFQLESLKIAVWNQFAPSNFIQITEIKLGLYDKHPYLLSHLTSTLRGHFDLSCMTLAETFSSTFNIIHYIL